MTSEKGPKYEVIIILDRSPVLSHTSNRTVLSLFPSNRRTRDQAVMAEPRPG
jgi:hypothetical protein